ncbi:MAG: metallophosphoesterase [Bacteroidales bacterium]|nr:metallophosphoesterase [Bacteroidales bacterium]
MVRYKYLLSLLVVFAGCSKIDPVGLIAPTSADVESRVSESLSINRDRGPIELFSETDDYNVHVCSDIHVEECSASFEQFLRCLRHDENVVAGLLLGDLINQKGSVRIVAEIIENTLSHEEQVPVMTIVGNHDLFFGQWEDYKQYFGSSTYFFVVRTPHYRDLYVMLDSGGGCHGKKQMDWLRQLLKHRNEYRHCVVCSHVNIFRTDLSQFVSGNLPLEETYQLLNLLTENNVELYLQGHDHFREEVGYNGVRYVVLDCLRDGVENASWIRLHVGEDLSFDFVEAG